MERKSFVYSSCKRGEGCMLEKLKEQFNRLKKASVEKKIIFSIIGIIIPVVTIAILLILIGFLKENFKEVIFLSLIVLCTWYKFNEHKKIIKEKEDILRSEVLQKEAAILEEEVEVTYSILQKEIFVVLGNIFEVLKVKKPQSLSEIVAPTNSFVQKEVVYYQFCCLLSGEGILDSNIFKDILQQRITQRLMAYEVFGLKQSFYVYEGRTYPLIKVVDIEYVGVNAYITVTIVNEIYCKEEFFKSLIKKDNYSKKINTGDCDF